ncbi:MAG TPA: sigma-70 family RNA polymerase sigma factor, partial [Gemmataceae bacterium]|nr:sigma-70 family RNA polymerase sigma factor [Gemmataceae bacterium]
MANSTPSQKSGRRRYVVAMVLGTALSALGPATGMAAGSQTATLRAVNDMSRYCTACWRNARLPPDTWGDCTQEVLSRMLERVRPEAWGQVLHDEGEERREFLRAIDTVKKRTQRARKWAAAPMDGVADRNEAGARRRAEERDAVVQAARRLLSDRQRRIMQLSLDGWSVQDIAAE